MTQGTQPGAWSQPRGVGWGGTWEGCSSARGQLNLQLIHADVW